MTQNPLKKYFRKPAIYVRLPTQGRWYTGNEVIMTEDGEVAIYPMGAIDDIMLNTPDAMLNGQALEKVISSCCPDVKNVKRLMIPDLEAIFVGMKSAANDGKMEIERVCPKCQAENTFDLRCDAILAQASEVNPDDTIINFDGKLMVHVRPYDFEMRQIFIKREFEEDKLIRGLQVQNSDMGDLDRAAMLAESVDRLSKITFALVSRSIEKIVMVDDGVSVTDRDHINEWLVGISKQQADQVMETVNRLNAAGISKSIDIECSSCGNKWSEQLAFDPTSFFGKRS